MFKYSLYLSLFYLFVSLVLSESNIPLRGTLKNVHQESSSEENYDKFSVNVTTIDSEKIVDLEFNSDSTTLINKMEDVPLNKTQQIEDQERRLSSDSAPAKCDNSFVMWFANGIAITTVDCGTYSAIYSGKASAGGTETRYIKGQVTEVIITSADDIKVNELKLSTISTEINSPSENTGRGSSSLSRILQDQTPTPIVEVYSFSVGDKQFDVYLPRNDQADKRDSYSLSYDGQVFYTGKENSSKFTLKENGDVVDSTNNVVLKGDSSSFALKTIYVIPTLFATLVSVFLF